MLTLASACRNTGKDAPSTLGKRTNDDCPLNSLAINFKASKICTSVLIPVGMASVRKSENITCWEVVERLEPVHGRWECEPCSHCGDQCDLYIIERPCGPANPLLGLHPRIKSRSSKSCLHSHAPWQRFSHQPTGGSSPRVHYRISR